MEQSKWVIVRRETGFEKFKRSIKSIFFKLFGKDEKCKNSFRFNNRNTSIN